MNFQILILVLAGLILSPHQTIAQESGHANINDVDGDWILVENQGPCYQILSFKTIKDGIDAKFSGILIGEDPQNNQCVPTKNLVAVRGLVQDGACLQTLENGYRYVRYVRADIGFKKELYSFRSVAEDPLARANHLNFNYIYSNTRSNGETLNSNLTFGGTSNCYYERMPEVSGR